MPEKDKRRRGNYDRTDPKDKQRQIPHVGNRSSVRNGLSTFCVEKTVTNPRGLKLAYSMFWWALVGRPEW